MVTTSPDSPVLNPPRRCLSDVRGRRRWDTEIGAAKLGSGRAESVDVAQSTPHGTAVRRGEDRSPGVKGDEPEDASEETHFLLSSKLFVKRRCQATSNRRK